MYADGSSASSSHYFRDRLGLSDPASRLKRKIRRSRSQAEGIVNQLAQFDDLTEQQSKDTALLQYFILEQFSSVKRYALRKQFFQFDCQPRLIGFWRWFVVWFFLISLWTFCIVYILFCAVSQGDTTTKAFSVQFSLFLVQDLLVNQIVQIYIIHVLTIELVRPQLKTINHVLNHVLNSKSKAPTSGPSPMMQKSRKERCGITDIVQHVSGACRAARHWSLLGLPSARLLLSVNDRDVLLCRQVRRQHMGFGTVIIIGVVALLAVSHDAVTSLFLELFIPTLWCFYLLVNSILVETNYMILVGFYCGVVAVIAFYWLIYSPARLFIKKCPDQIIRGRYNAFQRHKNRNWIQTTKLRQREQATLKMKEQHSKRVSQMSFCQRASAHVTFFCHRIYYAILGRMVSVILWFWNLWNRMFVSERIRAIENNTWRAMNRPLYKDRKKDFPAPPLTSLHEDNESRGPEHHHHASIIDLPAEIEEMKVKLSRGRNFWQQAAPPSSSVRSGSVQQGGVSAKEGEEFQEVDEDALEEVEAWVAL
jgi:hypothetical protein